MDDSIQLIYTAENDISKKNLTIDNSFANLTLSDIGVNEKKDEINNSNSEISNNKLEDFNNIFQITKRSKIKKEDLNNIPLPIFSCIYCSNEKISFSHMIKEILEKKYLLLTSMYDINRINKIIESNKKYNLIYESKEYIKKYYRYIESKIILKNNLKIKKNHINHKNNIKIKFQRNKKTVNKSTKYDFKLEDIIREGTKKNKNVKNNRKIKKKDIKWEPKYYNIWNPIIEPIYITQQNKISRNIIKNKKNMNKTPLMLNKNRINLKINSLIKTQNIGISNKKYKNKIPTYRNDKFTISKNLKKLFTNISCTNNKSSKNKNIKKINTKHNISKLITRSNSKNKIPKIVVNMKINKTPTKSKITKKFIGKRNHISNNQEKYNSQNNMLLKYKNISLKKQKQYITINPINLYKSSNKILKEKTSSKKNQSKISIKKNTKQLNKNLFHLNINKYNLSNPITISNSRNNSLNKIKISHNKANQFNYSHYLTSVSLLTKNNNKSINKSSKSMKKYIEINLKK